MTITDRKITAEWEELKVSLYTSGSSSAVVNWPSFNHLKTWPHAFNTKRQHWALFFFRDTFPLLLPKGPSDHGLVLVKQDWTWFLYRLLPLSQTGRRAWNNLPLLQAPSMLLSTALAAPVDIGSKGQRLEPKLKFHALKCTVLSLDNHPRQI